MFKKFTLINFKLTSLLVKILLPLYIALAELRGDLFLARLICLPSFMYTYICTYIKP